MNAKYNFLSKNRFGESEKKCEITSESDFTFEGGKVICLYSVLVFINQL